MALLAGLWRHHDHASEAMVRRIDARLDDPIALEALLGALPEARDLRARLAGPFFARAWDGDAQLDHWIVSDGVRVTCYTVGGLTLQQAAGVRVRWDALRGRAALSEALLADLVASQTGRAVTLAS